MRSSFIVLNQLPNGLPYLKNTYIYFPSVTSDSYIWFVSRFDSAPRSSRWTSAPPPLQRRACQRQPGAFACPPPLTRTDISHAASRVWLILPLLRGAGWQHHLVLSHLWRPQSAPGVPRRSSCRAWSRVALFRQQVPPCPSRFCSCFVFCFVFIGQGIFCLLHNKEKSKLATFIWGLGYHTQPGATTASTVSKKQIVCMCACVCLCVCLFPLRLTNGHCWIN